MWLYFTAHSTVHYIDVLSEFIKSYNHSFHKTNRAKPVDVNPSNSARFWKAVYGDAFKIKESVPLFKKGDHVRVSGMKDNEIWEKFTD